MRIALIYSPPWKIPAKGQHPDVFGDGPPKSGVAANIEGDFLCIPYGLLSLAAQAMHAGHEVKIFNLSNFDWPRVESLLSELDADVFGLTCFTSNRRGVDVVSRHIRQFHPSAHIVVGGPHATALPVETLQHYKAIDTVVIGEGEVTFMELLRCLETNEPTEGLPGTAWQDSDDINNIKKIQVAQPRPRIDDLDSLVPIQDYFSHYMILTSRGCPGKCSFCASNAMWGKKVSFHSEDYVLDNIEKTLPQRPTRTLAFKDDTFTANRPRAMRICKGIVDRGLNFLWSCDTRADVLNEEMLREMRLAGCQMISLGVESASPKILENIGKHVTPDKVLAATNMAKKYGIEVRYYMIAGNRGETGATFKESLDFIDVAKPDKYLFSVLSIFPGTADFEYVTALPNYVTAEPCEKGLEVRKRNQRFSAKDYFKGDFIERWVFPDTSVAEATKISQWVLAHTGIQDFWKENLDGYRAILEMLPNLHSAHIDLGAACLHAGLLDEAETHILRALELNYPLPAYAHNYLGIIAAQRGDLQGLNDHLQQASQLETCALVNSNCKTFADWLSRGGPKSGAPLELTRNHDYQFPALPKQPVMPGPLHEDCCQWEKPALVSM